MDKGSFVYFDRGTVEAAMILLGFSGARKDALSGKNRRHHFSTVMDFDTFDSYADPVAYFGKAMHIELEHGKAASDVNANVTSDDALATAKIVKAHLCGVEFEDYMSGEKYVPFSTYYDGLMWLEELHKKAYRNKMDKSLV
jgi:hypothetical protein